MKRARDSETSPTSSADLPAKRIVSKRAKSSQACASCRKHKTRCELLDSSGYLSRCHRCEVLSIPCSFETNAPPRNIPVDNSPAARFRRDFAAQVLLAPSKPSASSSPDSHPEEDSCETCSPWDFIRIAGLDDWTATPILAMQTLSRAACPDMPSAYPRNNFTMAEILSTDQRRYLLNFFEMHYSPWLALPPHALGDEEILDLVRCTIASRHLDPVLRARVSLSLRRLTEEAIMKHVFNPTPSTAVIQAFSMLALWSPFDNKPPGASDTHDSRLIAASAVTMCTSLRFDQAAAEESAFDERRKRGEEPSFQDLSMYTSAERRNSIWTCVHNVEAMVCLGTGRSVSSKALDFDIRRIGLMACSTVENARKTRMSLNARLFDLTESGLALQMSEDASQYDNYYDDVAEILYRFDGILRIVLPLPVATDHEAFYFHMLVVHYHACRLTFLVHTLRHMRKHVPPTLHNGGFFFAKIKRTGCGLALSCARDALLSAESLITTVLSIVDKEMLATAPDAVFSMISFAAAFIVAAKFMLLQSQGLRTLPGSSDQILCRIVARLNQISLSADHPAARCATVISQFMGNWDKRLAAFDGGQEKYGDHVVLATPTPPKPRLSESTSPESMSSEPATVPITPQHQNPPQSFEGFDYSQHLDQDALFGLEFWQYFSEMPLQQVPTPMDPHYPTS